MTRMACRDWQPHWPSPLSGMIAQLRSRKHGRTDAPHHRRRRLAAGRSGHASSTSTPARRSPRSGGAATRPRGHSLHAGRPHAVHHPPDLGLVSRVNVGTRRVEMRFPSREEAIRHRRHSRVAHPCSSATGVPTRLSGSMRRQERRPGALPSASRRPVCVVDEVRSRAYVADRESDQVSVVDTMTMERPVTIPTGQAPFALALSPVTAIGCTWPMSAATICR